MLDRRTFLGTLPTGLASPLWAQSRKPNIILIISDDHHWQCLGAAGNPHVRTPNLDKLAARGVMFTQSIVSSSQCAPSRGALLSGLEPYHNGLDCNDPDHTKFRFFQGATVVEQLRRAGYATNLVGKWHILDHPKKCGFSEAPIWLSTAATGYVDPPLRHGIGADKDTPTPGHITSIFSGAARKVIREARQPYLLWLAYNAPHTPWTASEEFAKPYLGRNASLAPPAHPANWAAARPAGAAKGGAKKGGKKGEGGGAGGSRPDGAFDWETYYAVISELDAAIGGVIEEVEKAGQWSNTLILFFGDNGYLCGSKGLQGKVHAWEESIRIPFLAAGGLVSKPAKSAAPVASIDVPATVLDYAGVPPAHKMHGASLRPAIEGRPFAREAAFSSWNDGRLEALYARTPVEPYRLVRTARHKYVVWESKREAFYDLQADPHEEKNVASDASHAGALKAMKDRLRARMKETADPAIAWL